MSPKSVRDIRRLSRSKQGEGTKSRAKHGRGTKLRDQALFWRWNLGGETKHVTIVIEEVFSTDNDEDDVDFFKWWWLWGRNLRGDKTCHNIDWKRCLSRLSLIYQHHVLSRDIWECKGGSNKDKKEKMEKIRHDICPHLHFWSLWTILLNTKKDCIHGLNHK